MIETDCIIFFLMLSYIPCNNKCTVNGAESKNFMGVVKSVARNATTDFPVLAVYATIGNDICSRGHTLDHVRSVFTLQTMTKVFDRVLGIMSYKLTVVLTVHR